MSIVVTDNENGSRVVYLDVEQMLGAAGVVTLVVVGERHRFDAHTHSFAPLQD